MDMFIDCLRGKPELRDYKSPEKEIIKEKFNTIPYMDVWVSNVIEGYIYEKVSSTDTGIREEYTERYRKIEGEYKSWYPNGQLYAQCYYKEGKEEEDRKKKYRKKVEDGDGQHSTVQGAKRKKRKRKIGAKWKRKIGLKMNKDR